MKRRSAHRLKLAVVDPANVGQRGAETDRWIGRLQRAVLDWAAHHHRQLPWRETRDPYAVWVSEIMLQQTQVATVERYFRRFLSQFPTLQALAGADEKAVLRAWEGLGYYRRARYLHAAAKQLLMEQAGRLPTDPAGWRALPGIGRYTANAILSLAFGQRQPIVEANTQRLYARLLAVRDPLVSSKTQSRLWSFAEQLLPAGPRVARTFNLALMDLGSEVCLPKTPNCGECPLRANCAAHAQGLEQEIPGQVKQVAYEARHDYAVVLRNARRQFWLRQCGEDEEWSGLWDLPRVRFGAQPSRKPDGELPAQFARQFGLHVTLKNPLMQLRHGVTRYRITLHVFDASPRAALLRNAEYRRKMNWFDAEQLPELPLHVTARRVLSRVLQSDA